MTSTAAATDAPSPTPGTPGRPLEIEEWSNRRLIHPLSRALVALLIPTPVTPNAVSVAGAAAAAAAAAAFVALPALGSAVVGACFLFAWHVLDGADGDLARRTGRASANGEMVDGICDHLGQAAIYLGFALILSPSLGALAWPLCLASGASRIVQASVYEGLRRNYRRWVYDARWIRHTLPGLEREARGPVDQVKLALARAYVAVSARASADDRALEAAMASPTAAGGETAARARALYRERMLPVVKRASALSANYRSLAMALAVLVGAPVLFPLWEIVGLNLVLLALRRAEARANAAVVEALAGSDHDR